jgi:hypothetical protein
MRERTAFLFIVIAMIPTRFAVSAFGSRVPESARAAGLVVDIYLSIYEAFMVIRSSRGGKVATGVPPGCGDKKS